jgi:hypothetical protein
MINWLNRLFSDPQGIPDDARVWSFALVISFIWLEFSNVYFLKQPFDAIHFATATGILATSLAAMLRIRGNT